ncbi:hypothetical protein NDU88_004008 [Pleurodeles waltl]|uniref:Uncharacterized protein n=1 Tax=Pleurodeles waltl TaxID=8319 RepID=A0AAV7TRB7_PLEWA|nr:hypothetical protein NDU88_004008 [Pleurodeles waltl]
MSPKCVLSTDSPSPAVGRAVPPILLYRLQRLLPPFGAVRATTTTAGRAFATSLFPGATSVHPWAPGAHSGQAGLSHTAPQSSASSQYSFSHFCGAAKSSRSPYRASAARSRGYLLTTSPPAPQGPVKRCGTQSSPAPGRRPRSRTSCACPFLSREHRRPHSPPPPGPAGQGHHRHRRWAGVQPAAPHHPLDHGRGTAAGSNCVRPCHRPPAGPVQGLAALILRVPRAAPRRCSRPPPLWPAFCGGLGSLHCAASGPGRPSTPQSWPRPI